MGRSYTVGEVARVSHVTVRALHHYDEIGLLVPSQRSRAGYRLYDEGDLRKLQRITVLRELGFSLDVVRELLASDGAELYRALVAHGARLRSEIAQKQAVLRSVEAAITLGEPEQELKVDDVFKDFESFEQPPFEQEAKERWGQTDSYRESARRTGSYTKEDWQRLKDEAEAIVSAFAQLAAAGDAADSDAACQLAERHRLHIDRWFYPCSHAHHEKLAVLYVEDARFAAYFEQHAAGLASFVSASIAANAQRTRDCDKSRTPGASREPVE